jgi:hypothetical protein
MQTPILITAFRRPELLTRVVEALKGIDNPVYFWIDGPRTTGRESQLVSDCIRIANQASLNTFAVKINQINIGTDSVANGITWVLKTHPRVIVIEEDILVSKDFIQFAEQMLDEYESDLRIGSITAMNNVPTKYLSHPKNSYRFSVYFYAWGWATWANRWEHIITDMSDWDYRNVKWPCTSKSFLSKMRWKRSMEEVRTGRSPGLWDYRWIYTYWSNNWMTVVPNHNLATNIGFGETATHTRIEPKWIPKEVEASPILTLNTEVEVTQDKKADRWSAKFIHNSSSWLMLKTILKSFLLRLGKR